MASDGSSKPRSRVLRWVAVILLAVIAIPTALIYQRTRDLDDWVRDWVVRALTERFNSRVELESIHVSAFPELSVTGDNLTIAYHNRSDVPPMFQIKQFTFHLGVLGIFEVPRRISGLHLDNMVITIPPRGQPKGDQPPPKPNTKIKKPLPHIVIDEIVCDETTLRILPKQSGKEPLEWDIHDLVLNSVGTEKPFAFRGDLRNAKPVGEIATNGHFGPWEVDDPGATELDGHYKFSDADLDPFPGIGGKLSSTGTYKGELDRIEAQGVTDTPNFSLDPVGKAVPLHTEFSATVDGTNGDTYLHPVRATLIHSLIVANGSVVRVPEKKGHNITLDVVAPKARLEDLLQLATKSTKPMMSGSVNLKTKMILPPGKVKVLDKIILDGVFEVTDAKFASSDVRDKLASFSRRAQGQPDNPDAGSAISDLKGKFKLKDAVITFDQLTFAIPGANIQLDGTYGLRGEKLDFKGVLRLDAKLSQLVTGKKAFLLKAVDPFFSKHGAGTEIPIGISGTRDNPTLEFSVFHHTIKKNFGSDKADKNQASHEEKSGKRPE